MKPVAVLCLVLSLRQCLSIPLSTENILEQTKKSPQDDSVPIALLLVVPSSSQFRDDEENTPEEDISFIEDQIVNLLLRDADSFQEGHVREVLKKEPLFAEDLRALNPLLRSGEDIEVNILVEEPFLIKEDESILPELREDKDFEANVLEGLIRASEHSRINSVTHKEVRLVPEETLLSTEDSAQNVHNEGSSFPDEKPTIEDRPLKERAYENVEYVVPAPKAEQIVATYPEASQDAIPILLNCAPKVETGHLADTAPSYRSQDSKDKDIDIKENNFKTNDDFNDTKNSDVLDLNSPVSVITMERRKRHIWPETGAAHYKVSEDYPETFKGNHHLISADYPQPNMIRITKEEH